jgi:hypothetical protein
MAYEQRGFPTFSLLPYPEDQRQKYEWGWFMGFLSDKKKVSTICIVERDTRYACFSYLSSFREY